MRFLVAVILLTGCFVHEEDDIFIPEPYYDLAVPVPDFATNNSDGGSSTSLGSGAPVPQIKPAVHVQSGGSVTVPDGQYGFTVTANGQGGYRVAWVDAANANLRYHGSVFVHGSFSQVSSTGMNYATAGGERLDFESQPGAGSLGYVDFVSSSDPITVDVLAGSHDGTLYYSDGNGFLQTAPTPGTFTSP